MTVGPGRPPKEHQWKKGQSGNPGGMTKERRRALDRAAELAARVLHRQLEAVEGVMLKDPTKERIVAEMITADIHRVVKEALDRADGTPRQAVDHTSSDGTMSPPPVVQRVIISAKDTDC
jgi:hypothetical protein